jgi:hypothetical protein
MTVVFFVTWEGEGLKAIKKMSHKGGAAEIDLNLTAIEFINDCGA